MHKRVISLKERKEKKTFSNCVAKQKPTTKETMKQFNDAQ